MSALSLRWLRLPVRDRCEWMTRASHLISRATPLPAFAPHRALFGGTFELCAVFDLAERMPYPHLLDALPPMEALWTAWRSGYQPPPEDPEADFRWWCRTEPVPRTWLHAAGSNLAQLLDLLYRYADTAEANQQFLAMWNLHAQSFNARRRVAAAEAATFRVFWQAHEAGPRDLLRQLGPVRAADVPFRGGYRLADLIAGTNLVEIKTGLMPDDKLAEAIVQAAEYALLAQNAGYKISDVVLYLARYQLIIQTPLQQLADDLAGSPVDLAAARSAVALDDPPWPPNARGRHHQGPMP
ncbi:hypothetical protein ACFO1B_21050 [Dactylosporangium siamense]|uniref:Uncharacterized protein n=1 Tax=Dactylosporangium siamense TaxID=685454 RepID=A0A919PQY7_9ACTN|nr:hypothetical protein [Dactylosporangium siamense]GIG46778.1 hypothetical protein Dsi01nite_048190 [Dactylosporangium siamense]